MGVPPQRCRAEARLRKAEARLGAIKAGPCRIAGTFMGKCFMGGILSAQLSKGIVSALSCGVKGSVRACHHTRFARRLKFGYFSGQPPAASMAASTSAIRRRVSSSAAMMRG